MYVIDETTATLDGEDLGHATYVTANPQIGQVPLPARGVLAIGQAAWKKQNNIEYATVEHGGQHD